MAMATRRVVPVSSPSQPRREYWRALVAAPRGSGLSQAAFCRRRGIPTGTFSFWKWTLAREAGARRAADGPARPVGLLGPCRSARAVGAPPIHLEPRALIRFHERHRTPTSSAFPHPPHDSGMM